MFSYARARYIHLLNRNTGTVQFDDRCKLQHSKLLKTVETAFVVIKIYSNTTEHQQGNRNTTGRSRHVFTNPLHKSFPKPTSRYTSRTPVSPHQKQASASPSCTLSFAENHTSHAAPTINSTFLQKCPEACSRSVQRRLCAAAYLSKIAQRGNFRDELLIAVIWTLVYYRRICVRGRVVEILGGIVGVDVKRVRSWAWWGRRELIIVM